MREAVPESRPAKGKTQPASAESQTPGFLKALPGCSQLGIHPRPFSSHTLSPPGMLPPATSKYSNPNHPFQVELKCPSFQSLAGPSPYPLALSIQSTFSAPLLGPQPQYKLSHNFPIYKSPLFRRRSFNSRQGVHRCRIPHRRAILGTLHVKCLLVNERVLSETATEREGVDYTLVREGGKDHP